MLFEGSALTRFSLPSAAHQPPRICAMADNSPQRNADKRVAPA